MYVSNARRRFPIPIPNVVNQKKRKEENRKSAASKECSDDDAQRQHADKDTV